MPKAMPNCDNAGEMSPGSSKRKLPSICSYRVEGKPRKNLNQLQNEIAVIDRDIERSHFCFSPTKNKRKYLNTDARISRIEERYENYKNSEGILDYLLTIGHNIAGNF
ncbi:hypothetical protein ANN_26586 [Periplaneta americana]|uniref:Uncharacterized protein n=1 Tax=Periplaneta americana TaxID=6978 RepID=A0ABQ8RYQ0_PERAM|nr:hypothetical protein ANN_26586 [Periplaneta americana]